MEDLDYNDPNKYINDESIEMAWAIKAAERANVHMNLLMACDTNKLRLNKAQDEIYELFRKSFPDLDVSKVTETELKQGDAKDKWRQYCEAFKEKVEDYSMGSLMRMEAAKAYSQENTIIVPKIQYLAIEIARNIEGVNERLKDQYTQDHRSNSAQL